MEQKKIKQFLIVTNIVTMAIAVLFGSVWAIWTIIAYHIGSAPAVLLQISLISFVLLCVSTILMSYWSEN